MARAKRNQGNDNDREERQMLGHLEYWEDERSTRRVKRFGRELWLEKSGTKEVLISRWDGDDGKRTEEVGKVTDKERVFFWSLFYWACVWTTNYIF